MLRFLLLAFFAALPLFAGAHEGHHRAPVHTDPTPFAGPVEANGVIVVTVAAPSRCPGGDELCCCHDLTFTTPSQPAALADARARLVLSEPIRQEISHHGLLVRRAVALVRHSPRGPPTFS